MSDPLKPPITLLMKIGSALVHFGEAHSPKGCPVDVDAGMALINDPEVQQWIKDMGVYLPVKR